MYSKFKSLIAGSGAMVLAIGLTAGSANASTISYGTLTSDSSTGVILDTVSGTEYTRLDAFDWTVAQVQASIQAGGAFDGWSILNAAQADIFASSILGVASTACSTNGSDREKCGQVAGWSDGDFGMSHKADLDIIAYLNDASTSSGGVLKISAATRMLVQNPNADFSMLDSQNEINGNAINLMLFRTADASSVSNADVSAVPLPASGLMLAGAFAGLGLMRRRRKAA